MMICRVLKSFSDLQDEKHVYEVGDWFPRLGFSVSGERIAELAGTKNAFGCPIIEVVSEGSAEVVEKAAETAQEQTEDVPAEENPVPAKRAGRRGRKKE